MKLNMNIAEPNIMEDLICGSNVLSEEEYRGIVVAISEYACSIVTRTLGPYGKTTNVDDSTFTAPTKDGWTVLRNIRFSDPLYNSIYNVINQISFDLVTKVGDGTTSALTGANVFLHIILEAIQNPESPLYGMRQSDLLAIIESEKTKIVENLRKSEEIHSIDPDGDFEDIYKIAYISSNGNETLARSIQDIYKATKNPNIFVTFDSGDKLSVDIQSGYKYDGYVINQKLYRNSEDGTYRIDTPVFVAVFDHNVTYNEHRVIIEQLSLYANAANTSVIIMAPYFDDIMTNIMNTTIMSFVQQRKIPPVVLMQIPLAGPVDRTNLSDFVLLTNGQIFDYGKVRALNVTVHNADPRNVNNKIEDALLDIKQYHFESVTDLIDTCIGRINRTKLGEKYLIIEGYENIYNKALYDTTIQEVKDEYAEIARRTNKSSNMLAKDYLAAQQRYIKLIGKMGTIRVGAQTELEKHCLKDAVDDAVLACRSAFNNGYIRGLNLTTLKTIRDLMIDELTDSAEEVEKPASKLSKKSAVLEMFYDVFMEMSMYVLRNKYPDIADNEIEYFANYPNCEGFKTTNSDVMVRCLERGTTFNLIENEFETDWTVINSLSTDVEILNSIVGVLSILLTSDQFISLNKNYDKKLSRKLQIEREAEKTKALEKARLEARMEVLKELDPMAKNYDIINNIFF